LSEAAADGPEALEDFDRPPKRDDFFDSRSASPLSLFLSPNGIVTVGVVVRVVFRTICGGLRNLQSVEIECEEEEEGNRGVEVWQ
jgi:hypothetical protein